MATIPFQTKTNFFLKIEDHSSAEILVIVCSLDVLCDWFWACPKEKCLKGLGRGAVWRLDKFTLQTDNLFTKVCRQPVSWSLCGMGRICINHWFAMTSLWRRRHVLNFFKMGMYLLEVTDWHFPLLSSKKNGPMIPWLLVAAQTGMQLFKDTRFYQILCILQKWLLWLHFVNIVTKFTGYMWHWMNITPWKNQTDVNNGLNFIRKIEDSVLYEQVGILIKHESCLFVCPHFTQSPKPPFSWNVGSRPNLG